MKKTVILYGIGLALAVGLMKFLQYRYIIQDLTLEVYLAIVASIFTAVGIWLGLKLIGNNKSAARVEIETSHIVDENKIRDLNISNREQEVLHLIALGLSNKEIADKLFVSISTVKTHSSNLFSKLDVKRRTQAIKKAKDLKII